MSQPLNMDDIVQRLKLQHCHLNSQEPEDQRPSTQNEGVLYFGILCTLLSYLISPAGTASAQNDEAP